MFSNPIAAYQQVDRDADIRGSDPHRLIQLLFDGALAALSEGKARLEVGDFAGKTNALVKAIAIICDGLSASLNLEEGGELAANLKALYDYMTTRLVHANIHNDVPAINEVERLLNEIGGAWREMGEQIRKSPPIAEK